MNRTSRAGFTLVEILTVIAIIALLSALIMGLAGLAQKKAARSKAEAEITQLESFISDYQAKYGQVPGSTNLLKSALASAQHSLSNMVDPWGETYVYTNTSKATFYLYSKGGGTNANDKSMWIGNYPP